MQYPLNFQKQLFRAAGGDLLYPTLRPSASLTELDNTYCRMDLFQGTHSRRGSILIDGVTNEGEIDRSNFSLFDGPNTNDRSHQKTCRLKNQVSRVQERYVVSDTKDFHPACACAIQAVLRWLLRMSHAGGTPLGSHRKTERIRMWTNDGDNVVCDG
ncbi:hypothetical protein HNQ77_001026 [Silvibacterium bohemicum]|uniref:Uncharacterized protein n=1 Tax=Silvibacterium bohemicum TaxID=1577686 RepID=A0A841JNY7_9BACT|nr:hypothetical protein [Silvibacterium bohemicum]